MSVKFLLQNFLKSFYKNEFSHSLLFYAILFMNHLFPTGTVDTENLPLAASPAYFDIKSSDRHCHRFYNGGQ